MDENSKVLLRTVLRHYTLVLNTVEERTTFYTPIMMQELRASLNDLRKSFAEELAYQSKLSLEDIKGCESSRRPTNTSILMNVKEDMYTKSQVKVLCEKAIIDTLITEMRRKFYNEDSVNPEKWIKDNL